MAKQEIGKSESIKPGDQAWYKGELVTVVYIVPAHQWPEEHDTRIDEGVRKFMTPPKIKFPPQQSRESVWHWKKWHEDMYIICRVPNLAWVSRMARVKLSELSLTPPEGKEPETNGTGRLQKGSSSRTK